MHKSEQNFKLICCKTNCYRNQHAIVELNFFSVTFTAWLNGQPDNYNGNEDCIHVRLFFCKNFWILLWNWNIIVIQTIFYQYENKNHKINPSFWFQSYNFSFWFPWNVVYYAMQKKLQNFIYFYMIFISTYLKFEIFLKLKN